MDKVTRVPLIQSPVSFPFDGGGGLIPSWIYILYSFVSFLKGAFTPGLA